MLTRSSFSRRFGGRAVFAMVHLGPLPGAPGFEGALDPVLRRAAADARAIRKGGADGIIVENFGDRPFGKTVGPVTVAAMTRAVRVVIEESGLPVGVNVLRNDGVSALAIAAATGAVFVRVNVLVGAMVTDQGIIEGNAAEVMRARASVAPEVAVFGDWMVKHAYPLGDVDRNQSALDLRHRAMADAIVISGRATGAAADPQVLEHLRDLLPDAPLVLGSGVSRANARDFPPADAAVVGTSVKRGGEVTAAVDARRLAALVASFKK
ncbi:MAG: BtpA/SgcQ family protein [Thermoanaerobaculia bacterium]